MSSNYLNHLELVLIFFKYSKDIYTPINGNKCLKRGITNCYKDELVNKTNSKFPNKTINTVDTYNINYFYVVNSQSTRGHTP